jgi:hypothetical protein
MNNMDNMMMNQYGQNFQQFYPQNNINFSNIGSMNNINTMDTNKSMNN